MKIALLRANPKDAAFGKVLKILSREFKIDCYIWDRQGDYSDIEKSPNIAYKRCKIRAGFYDVSTFLKLLLFNIWLFLKLMFAKIDCIHAIDLDTGLVGLFVAKLRAKLFVYHCLDPYYSVLPYGWPRSLGTLAKKVENVVISNSDMFIITDLLRMAQHEGAKPKQILEFANVPHLDISQIRGNKKEGFVAGYIGALSEGRNLITIVEAIGELKGEGVKLIIGGFGPLENKIKEYAKKYENIFYTSWIHYEKLLEIETTFDIFLHIADRENEGQRWTSPNKLFESMAFGRPIIVGDGTLADERVYSIGNGIAVKYGSKGELQKAILMLKNNPDIGKEMGERGRIEFEKNWSPEIMERRLLEAYGKLLI